MRIMREGIAVAMAAPLALPRDWAGDERGKTDAVDGGKGMNH